MTASRTMVTQFLAGFALLAGQPLYAQNGNSAVVFALMDKNEWCPGGTVNIDLSTGTFMLLPRQKRPACKEPKTQRVVERGKLGQKLLIELRSAYGKARQAGLAQESCGLVVSNGGPESLVVAGPAFAATTPENEGCWSKEAKALHSKLFQLFGEQR